MIDVEWVVVKIVIIDSGVNINHPLFTNEKIYGYALVYDEERKCCTKASDFDDQIGHGTAGYATRSARLSAGIGMRF